MFSEELEHFFKADESLLDVGVGIRPLAVRSGDNQVNGQFCCSTHPDLKGCHSRGRIHLGVVGKRRHWQEPAPTRIFTRQMRAHDAVERFVEALDWI